MTEYETITDPNEPMRVGDLVVKRVDAVDPARGSFDGTRVRLERPVPAPGTTGTATVRGVPGVRVIRTEIDPTPGLIRTQWASGVIVKGERMHTGSEVTNFVPDGAASDDADARLALLTDYTVREAIRTAFRDVIGPNPPLQATTEAAHRVLRIVGKYDAKPTDPRRPDLPRHPQGPVARRLADGGLLPSVPHVGDSVVMVDRRRRALEPAPRPIRDEPQA